MNHILVRFAEPAVEVATALEKVVDAQLRIVPAEVSDDEFVHGLHEPEAVIGVLALRDGAWDIVQRTTIPLVLVPLEPLARESRPYGIERILVPLDGTEEAAQSVAEAVGQFCAAGIEIMVLHVFDRDTVPAHWDQAAHARTAWENEFLARYCHPYFPGQCQTVTVRSGVPGESIVDVAAEEADLIVLGWSRQLLPGRARSVRQTIGAASVPILLIPVGPGDT
ncbi:universal stress protein [Nocardia sp. NPDC051030]|uniref:universal stress protein n=1 Tax=Nocardia sp. NPDC051030 TaxID=3155162 RepID=UPI0034132EBA